jgi:hypothetical protein
VPIEKQSGGGNSRVGSTPEEPRTGRRAKGDRASVSAGSTRAAAGRRSPRPAGRTRPPAEEPTGIWRSDDAWASIRDSTAPRTLGFGVGGNPPVRAVRAGHRKHFTRIPRNRGQTIVKSFDDPPGMTAVNAIRSVYFINTLLEAAVDSHALPWILAHHQRTPTNKKRQSRKNSGGLCSKPWPMN